MLKTAKWPEWNGKEVRVYIHFKAANRAGRYFTANTSHMWDLRDCVKLQIPSTRRAWKATWGQLLAPQSFTSLCYSHLHHALTVHTCADARAPTCHSSALWNSNPKASVSQVCSSWNTLNDAGWTQSIMIVGKCPHCHSIINSIKWDQMGLWHKTVFWMRDRAQLLSARRRVRVSDSDPDLLLWKKRGPRIISLREVITSNTRELPCAILDKTLKWV